MKEQNRYKRKFKKTAIILKIKPGVFSVSSVDIKSLWKKYVYEESHLKLENKTSNQLVTTTTTASNL